MSFRSVGIRCTLHIAFDLCTLQRFLVFPVNRQIKNIRVSWKLRRELGGGTFHSSELTIKLVLRRLLFYPANFPIKTKIRRGKLLRNFYGHVHNLGIQQTRRTV